MVSLPLCPEEDTATVGVGGNLDGENGAVDEVYTPSLVA